jgi:hypothetical protein
MMRVMLEVPREEKVGDEGVRDAALNDANNRTF